MLYFGDYPSKAEKLSLVIIQSTNTPDILAKELADSPCIPLQSFRLSPPFLLPLLQDWTSPENECTEDMRLLLPIYESQLLCQTE